MAGPIPIPLHIGRLDPAAPLPVSAEAEMSPKRPDPEQGRRSRIADVGLDWPRLGVEPHWLGSETAECVAAVEPGHFAGRGQEEFDRFVAGAQSRDETAVVLSMLGSSGNDPAAAALGIGEDTLWLPGAQGSVGAQPLPKGSRPQLAPDLDAADHDLGLRLLNRPGNAPWWSLGLRKLVTDRPGVELVNPLPGTLEPILVDALGNPVVAAWVPAHDQDLRWYIVPDDTDWAGLIDWLVERAIPHYVPQASRRFRLAGSVDPGLRTPREDRARAAIAAMEVQHAEERQRLEAEVESARREADEVRDGLLHGSGTELVHAVARVLDDAGLAVVDLDAGEKGTWSADLLVDDGGLPRLIEVKSEGRAASERLVDDVNRHLATWRAENPGKPVSGGTLIVNHQRKTDPLRRSAQVYTRLEFVRSLTVPVIGTLELFEWWKQSDWPAIRAAVLGEAERTGPAPEAGESAPPAVAAPRSGWRRWWRRNR